MSGPEHFKKLREGQIEPLDGVVRLSTVARRLRAGGSGATADTLEADAKVAAPWCPKCERKLDDPAIGLLGDRVAFVCPWCSDPELLRQWEAEGHEGGGA